MSRRSDLAALKGASPRLVRELEDQSSRIASVESATVTAVAATEAIQDATVLSLSRNAALNNERVVVFEDGLVATDAAGELRVKAGPTIARAEGGDVRFVAPTGGAWFLPLSGILVARASPDTLSNKTLERPKATLLAAADDAAAAAAGVAIGELYEASGAVRVRKV